MNRDFAELDSLLRFYSSQVTAHSNYLVGLSFAFAVFFYTRLITGIEGIHLAWYNIVLTVFFIAFGLWLYGRLLYYSELALIVETFMGLLRHNGVYWDKYRNLIMSEREKRHGLATMVSAVLSNRIRYRLLHKVDQNRSGDKAFVDVIKLDGDKVEFWKACLVTFGCILLKRYRDMLKDLIRE